jgi:hypothetical protein
MNGQVQTDILGIYKTDRPDSILVHGGFWNEINTILKINYDSTYYKILFSELDEKPYINFGKWSIINDTLILTGNEIIKQCEINVNCIKSGNNTGLKLNLKTIDGKPIKGKVSINSSKFKKSKKSGIITISKSQYYKTIGKYLSSFHFKFRKYRMSMTSNFDESCNEFEIISDINPNIMPPKYVIEKWLLKDNRLLFINSINNEIYIFNNLHKNNSLSKIIQN